MQRNYRWLNATELGNRSTWRSTRPAAAVRRNNSIATVFTIIIRTAKINCRAILIILLSYFDAQNCCLIRTAKSVGDAPTGVHVLADRRQRFAGQQMDDRSGPHGLAPQQRRVRRFERGPGGRHIEPRVLAGHRQQRVGGAQRRRHVQRR